MKISTKGRYALRLLVDLARHQDDGYIALKDIAQRQNISKKYLEQIIPILNRANILQSNRGFQGGYKLARSPKDISAFEVLTNTEGNMSCITCLEGNENTCPRKELCETLFVWEGLNKVIYDYLKNISIQDILDHQQNFTYII